MLKQLNPPFSKGNVDVLAVDAENLIVLVSFRIYHGKAPVDLPQTIQRSVFGTLRYMENEGFIEPFKTWDTRVGIVLYPSTHNK